MAFDNPFVLPVQEYRRDLEVFKHYIKQVATYLCIMTGADEETAVNFVKLHLGRDKDTGAPLGLFPFTDPMVKYLERNAVGDRELKECTLSRYIGESIRNDEIIAPTFTTYIPASQKQSLLALFIDENVKGRSVAKKAMFKARMEGNKILEILKDNEQTNRKLSNNACSGAHVSASTPLFNKTSHSTLTSNCRITAGYGSANNEKLLNGNRHYWSPEVVKNNLISIVSNSDYERIAATMCEFGIRHPTIEETMECIRYSTVLYWHNDAHMDLIHVLVTKLTDIQRSAFVYTGDLYHLMKYNEQLVRFFIHDLSSRMVPEGCPEGFSDLCEWPKSTNPLYAEADAIIKASFEDHRALATQLCPQEMKGRKVDDVTYTDAGRILAATITNIEQSVTKHANLIKAFFVTKNVPASLAKFPESIRRSALMGDTDSTIFTVQDWVHWYNGGRHGFDHRSSGVAATMIFLAAQTVTHLLARMSANLGIEEKRMFQVAMKNEYKFDVFVPTQVAKHYFASIGCQEGNLYAEQKEEIKGVHLKSSNAPRVVMAKAKAMMIEIMDTIMQEKELSIIKYLDEIATLEHDIRDSIMVRSSYEYFRMGQIKTAESYTLPPEKSNFAHYTFWNATFGTKYGVVPEPPYMSVKISVTLDSATKLKAWLSKMEDRALAEKIASWCVANGKKGITTFHVPEQVIQSIGIPPEILEVVDVRKIQIDTVNVFYILLESLGLYVHTNKNNQLVSDYYEGNQKAA